MNVIPKPKKVNLNKNKICLHIENITWKQDNDIEKEGYKIDIQEDNICIYYRDLYGKHYAKVTYESLLKEGYLPCGTIEDYPNFHYRGVHLDVARHFLNVEEVKAFISLISKLKFNILHLHLTDEQGWRMEVNKYPLLTKLGSKRAYSNFGRTYDNNSHEGYYTKAQLIDIVKYAKERCVDILPEFDIPGHCSSILVGYPQLSCTNEKVSVKTRGGVFDEILCAGNDDVYQFVYDVIDTICEIFPYDFIHIGADEAKKEHWRNCPKCQAKMKQEGIASVAQLQDYFVHKVSEYIREKGKKAIIFSDGLRPNNQCEMVDVQYWVGDKEETKKMMKKGSDVIVSQHGKYYFDLCYGQTSLKSVYDYDPCSAFAPYENKVKGVEGMLWSEFMKDYSSRIYKGFPRLLALSETAWNHNHKEDYENFKERCRIFIDENKLKTVPEKMWDMSKIKRIKDMIHFYHSTMTKQDVKQFLSTLKNERKEKEENEKIT